MLGKNIRELRKRYNLTIEELAKALGSNYSTLGMYENGKRHPDYEMLDKIATYFNVSVDALLGREELTINKPIKYLKFIRKAEAMNIDEQDLDSLLDTLIKFKK